LILPAQGSWYREQFLLEGSKDVVHGMVQARSLIVENRQYET
jgi:hypothetical protein